jgi:hypothetical protein
MIFADGYFSLWFLYKRFIVTHCQIILHWMVEERSAQRILVGKTEGKRHLKGKSWRNWMGWCGLDSSDAGWNKRQPVRNMAMNLWGSIKCGEFFDWLRDSYFSIRTVLHIAVIQLLSCQSVSLPWPKSWYISFAYRCYLGTL